MNRVFITDYITDPEIEKSILQDEVSTIEKENAEILLVWHKLIDSNYLDNFPKASVLIRYGVGCDNIDFEETKKEKITVCNTPDYGVDEVSDTALGMILNLTRSINRYNELAKKINDGTWQENIISEIRRSSEMSVGILGAGRIGGSLLLKCQSVGFKTSFYDPYLSRGLEKTYSSIRYDDLEEFISSNDIISINATQTATSFEMIDENFINKMKNGSFLINTARGKIIKNIDNFIEPLKNGKILGIALDVLPTEPPTGSALIESWRNNDDWLDNKLIINPHSGYYSKSSWHEMRLKVIENAKRVLDGLEPFNEVKQR